MPAGILGDVVEVVGEPAWHRLGTNYPEGTKVLATEAFMHAPIEIVKEPLTATITTPTLFGAPMTTVVETGYSGLFRLAGPKWEMACLGPVGPDYHLISPEMICNLWDFATGNAGIETYALLGEGEMFITQRLPDYDVKGDECTNHLVLYSPWGGNKAIRLFETPTRVVCRNTLNIGIQYAGSMFQLKHAKATEAKLVKWMGEMQANALQKAGEMQAALTKLAETRVSMADVDALLAGIMPCPNAPRPTPDKEENARKAKTHKDVCRNMRARRSEVRILFEGAGIGMDTPACAGTAFGLFNAVAEYCDHGPANKGSNRNYDTLFGKRAEWKEQAYFVLSDLALNGSVPTNAYDEAYADAEMAIVR